MNHLYAGELHINTKSSYVHAVKSIRVFKAQNVRLMFFNVSCVCRCNFCLLDQIFPVTSTTVPGFCLFLLLTVQLGRPTPLLFLLDNRVKGAVI